jgi:hypothetical protein
MRRNECIPRLIDEIHDAALDANAWPRVLERLTTAFGASSAHLATQNTAMRNGAMVSFGSDPVYAQRYADYYVSRNVLWQRTIDMPQGHVVTDRMIMPREELRRSEFFNDFLRPQDGEEILVSKALRRQHRSTVVTLWRPAAAGSWQDEHVAALATLTPHLRQALRVNLQIGELQRSRDGAYAALDRLGDGVLIVDGGGKILFANSHASQWLRQSDGVCCEHGRVRAAVSEENTVLRRLIARAVHGNEGAPQSGLMRLTRACWLRLSSYFLSLNRTWAAAVAVPSCSSSIPKLALPSPPNICGNSMA